MPIWPFRKRRSNSSRDSATAASSTSKHQSLIEDPYSPTITQSTGAAARSQQSQDHHQHNQLLQRRPSITSQRKRRAPENDEKATDHAPLVESSNKRQSLAEKENARMPTSPKPPTSSGTTRRRHDSNEDITALPFQQRLDHSPHLRPVEGSRSGSRGFMHSSHSQAEPGRVQRHNESDSSILRYKSTKKRRDDHLRENEIRRMSNSIPVLEPNSEVPTRSNSKRHRGVNRGSTVSLPPPAPGSIDSIVSVILEQRGWEVGTFDIFSPRPSVRVSSQPQYGSPTNYKKQGALLRHDSQREKDKRPVRRSDRKRQTIGDAVDDFDASDIRFALERDAKRKEKKMTEEHEKMERKLRQRQLREYGEGQGKKRRQADETRQAEQARRQAEQEAISRDRDRQGLQEDSDVHPALRNRPAIRNSDPDPLGLGIHSPLTPPRQGHTPVRNTITEEAHEDPFADPEHTANIRSPVNDRDEEDGGYDPQHESLAEYTPMEVPMGDAVLETAQAVRYSHANTPPLSPINTRTTTSHMSDRQPRSLSLPEPPPLHDWDRRTSDPKEVNKRAGAWASIFRRGGTLLKKADESDKTTPSEFSFSNTSRESMRHQPLPAHLAEQSQSIYARSRSGTPVRTQSKFREDLPDMPLSPPDSRVHTPDVPVLTAASVAAGRRGKQPIPESEKHESESISHSREYPANMAVAGRDRVLASASLASIDSEGSWLAGGPGKRASNNSGLSRSKGSLSKRRSEWNASYEELGGSGDRDAEYLQQRRRSATFISARRGSSQAVAGAAADENETLATAMEEPSSRPQTPATDRPFTVHQSVRRQPTLVKRDGRLKSQEVLLGDATIPGSPVSLNVDTESPSKASIPGDGGSIADSPDTPISPAKLGKATSINYGPSHARQMSAGSAKLLDIVTPSPSVRRASSDERGRHPVRTTDETSA